MSSSASSSASSRLVPSCPPGFMASSWPTASTRLVPRETPIRVGCGCECQYWSDTDTDSMMGWVQCACISCGHVNDDGGFPRRCLSLVAPTLSVVAFLQSGEKRVPLPFCGSCRDECLLAWRKEAVIRAREARKKVASRFAAIKTEAFSKRWLKPS